MGSRLSESPVPISRIFIYALFNKEYLCRWARLGSYGKVFTTHHTHLSAEIFAIFELSQTRDLTFDTRYSYIFGIFLRIYSNSTSGPDTSFGMTGHQPGRYLRAGLYDICGSIYVFWRFRVNFKDLIDFCRVTNDFRKL